jgi:hypothetical protein
VHQRHIKQRLNDQQHHSNGKADGGKDGAADTGATAALFGLFLATTTTGAQDITAVERLLTEIQTHHLCVQTENIGRGEAATRVRGGLSGREALGGLLRRVPVHANRGRWRRTTAGLEEPT